MTPVGFEPTISAGERPQTARPLGPANELIILSNVLSNTPVSIGQEVRNISPNLENKWFIAH